MPLMPKRTKYRKMQKGRNRGKATRGNKLKNQLKLVWVKVKELQNIGLL